MRAEKVLTYLLSNNSGVTAIIGASPPKLYACMAPQRDLAPFCVYAKEFANRTLVIAGQPTIVEAVISVQVVALDYGTLKSLGEAVRLALVLQRGNIAGVDVILIKVDQEGGDSYDPELRLFGQGWIYSITHQE